MTRAIAIPEPLRAEIYAHARAAFPAECCGYLVGDRDGEAVDAIVVCHNAQRDVDSPLPDRDADTAFVIAGAELLAFARSFDSARPARVVYHSHTNGRAYLSPADRALAATDGVPAYPVQHLVVGVTADRVVECSQFAWSAAGREYLEIARWSVA